MEIEQSSTKGKELEVKKTTNKKKVNGKAEDNIKEEKETLKIENEDLTPQEEGQLAIDVYETDDDIVVQSTIGGIKAEDLDIAIEDDMVTIRGSRENKTTKEDKKYFYQECYWGSFMRKMILPEEVDANKAKAVIKEGILTLSMPKIHRKTKKKIAVQKEE